jgi:sulfur-carrier protein
MATVHVLLFGSLSERFRARELEAALQPTVRELWHSLPGAAMLRADGMRVARNRSYCDWTTELQEGDEVAFMPPVSGG